MPFLTTTIAAETGHNTSANAAYNQTNYAANFTGTTWVDNTGTTLAVDSTKRDDSENPITPCHVSPKSVKLLIPNFSGKWHAHLTPWFRAGGGGGHIDVGINCNSTAWVAAAMIDIKARDFDGVIIDWYGSTNYIDSVTLLIKSRLTTNPGLTYCIMIDWQSYATTSDLETHLTYIKNTYFSDPNYLTQGGLPVVMFFNVVGGVNYTTAKAFPGVSMYWVFQGSGSLANSYADACFDWVQPYATGVPGGDPYNATAANSFLTNVHSSAKGSIPCISPGFDGYLTASVGWSKGKFMPRDAGKCWLSQAAVVNANVPTNCIGIQVPTWDDWEEGSEVESAIDNEIAVSATVAGHTLTWSISGGTGDESTIDTYRILATPDGINAAVIGTQATGGANSFDLSTVAGWTSGTTYTIWVVAQGKACIRSKWNSSQTFTPSGIRATHESLLISSTSTGTTRSAQEALLISVTAAIMSINYPLNPPAIAGLGPQDFTMQMVNVVGETESPFTLGQQEQQWQGQLFRIEANLPPMLRAQAEQWIAFMGALFGKVGTFLMGDYNAVAPRGVATGSPVVSGAGNANGLNQLFTRGWTASIAGILKAGDYIQLNAAGKPIRLHKVLLDANSDGGGNATLQIFPNIRETLADGNVITVANTVGTFRLQENIVTWKEDRNRIYSISFKAKEAI